MNDAQRTPAVVTIDIWGALAVVYLDEEVSQSEGTTRQRRGLPLR